jgi:hypothetical protein
VGVVLVGVASTGAVLEEADFMVAAVVDTAKSTVGPSNCLPKNIYSLLSSRL